MRIFFKNRKILPVLTFILVSLLLFMPLLSAAKGNDTGISIETTVGQYIGNMILSTAAALTWVGGMILDYSIREIVIEMGEKLNNSSLSIAIDNAWRTIRDVANLAFIFGFVYIGIKTIFDFESSQTKKMLASIIIGALFINFSLFFTKVIIDASNLLAVSIYNQATSGIPADQKNLGEILAGQMGLSSLYAAPNPETFSNLTGAGNVWFYILGSIFLLVAAFTFAAGGILLIIRFVALILIMVFSPVLFAALVFPKTAHYANDLFQKLLSYAFFAPIYLFLIFISIALTKGVLGTLNPNNTGLSDSITNSSQNFESFDSFGVILNFIIVIMFMIFSLTIAQKLGVVGGTQAVKIGQNLRKGVQGYMGRGAVAVSGLNKLSEKHDDLRTSDKAGHRALALGMRMTGINAAAKAASQEKFGSSKSRADTVKESKERGRKIAQNKQVTAVSNAITAGTRSGAIDDDLIKMEQAVRRASTEELIATAKKFKKGSPEYKKFAATLSNPQFDKLMDAKPEDFNESNKSALRAARSGVEGGVAQRLTEAEDAKNGAAPGTATIEDVIGKADGKDLDALGYDTVLERAELLSAKQIDDMNLTPTEKSRMKDRRNAGLIEIFNTNGPRTIFGQFRDSEAAKLPVEILKDPVSAEFLNTNVLNKIPDNDGVSSTERAEIKSNVLSYHSGRPSERQYKRFFNNTPLGNRF